MVRWSYYFAVLYRDCHELVYDQCRISGKKGNFLQNFFLKALRHVLAAGIDLRAQETSRSSCMITMGAMDSNVVPILGKTSTTKRVEGFMDEMADFRESLEPLMP